jgi:EAL domain-containing protein (putative c-di-GMP-specific phosphodiesterase class I)
VTEAKQKNALLGVTGVLLHDGTHFLQVLEGPITILNELVAIIEADPRHQHFVTLVKEPIAKREYSSWSMESVKKDAYALSQIEQNFQALHQHLEQHHKNGNSQSRSELITQAFRQGEWSGVSVLKHAKAAFDSADYQAQSLGTVAEIEYPFAFQPIVDVDLPAVMWAESLIRGANGQKPLSLFAGLDIDEIHAIDAKSKHDALRVFSQFDARCGITLNLLPGTLIDSPQLVDELADLADELGIKRDSIVIELTEQEAIEFSDKILNITNAIKAKGFQLAIDDFGSGYAGLTIMVELQPHIIKIDRSIVHGVASNGPREAIIDSIIYCAKRLGISIIAEGVETKEDLDWLYSAGIKRFQGFLLAKPAFMALPEIEAIEPSIAD